MFRVCKNAIIVTSNKCHGARVQIPLCPRQLHILSHVEIGEHVHVYIQLFTHTRSHHIVYMK